MTHTMNASAASRSKKKICSIFAALLAAVCVFPFVFNTPFYLHTAIFIFMYAALGQSWNFIGGETGQVSFGQAIFFGIGAYVSTAFFAHFHLNPWLGMILGGLVAVLISWPVGKLTFKLSGSYFTIATIALGEMSIVLARRWEWIGGARGMYMDMTPEGWLNFQFHSSKIPYYFIVFVLMLITFGAGYAVKHSKLGFYFRAIREDEVAASSLGVDVPKFKLIAFAFSAFFAAIVGTFYAQYSLYIDPDSLLGNTISLQFAFICILGGVGTLVGPLIGSIALIILQQATTAFLGGANAVHLIIYGLLIVLIALFEPRGLVAIFNRAMNFYAKRAKKHDKTIAESV